MSNKKLKFLSSAFFTILMLFLKVSATEYTLETEFQKRSFEPNEQATMSFIIKSTEPTLEPEPFKSEVKFDKDVLKYSKINCKNNIKRNDIKIEKNDDKLTLVYNPKKLRNIIIKNNKCEIFDIVFTIKNKVCSDTSLIHTEFKNLNSGFVMCSSNSEINITGNSAMESCKLESLVPEIEDISPDFNPNIFQYSIEVPSETKNLDFYAVPMREDLAVKISRHKLAAAGKITNIKVTVSDKNLRIKSVYNIEVKRKSKDSLKNLEKGKENTGSVSNDKSNSGAKNKAKNKKHQKSSKYDSTEIESKDCEDEIETESTAPDSNSDLIILKNNSIKIYFISALCIVVCAGIAYLIIKFRKKLFKKFDNSLNNELQK